MVTAVFNGVKQDMTIGREGCVYGLHEHKRLKLIAADLAVKRQRAV